YRVVYKSGKTLDEAKAELREMVEAGAQDGKGGDGVAELQQFLAFIDASQRGIIR
ncbi:acyl-[acyl-carrier-protein]--UDP-N-acetylglucosamine O-acyltransferase, partial [Burkholderia cenocepacia]|nr:acyl-[acyl-carrier-protein]--UDP-N-acetylglucosamine O-acyltransferase [Burkholderia cenocepacia]